MPNITYCKFSPYEIEILFEKYSLSTGQLPSQVRYLVSYLSSPAINAQTIVIEENYVDRHYLEEFIGYYATQLRKPESHATRLHFFSESVDVANSILRINDQNAYRQIVAELQASYLGFVVMRPLPSAPIGRTILRHYSTPANANRCYGPPSVSHRVHLAGIELLIEGIPFQQQEEAVGACATTALWSSLARVMRTDGNRSITPVSVTNAAHQNRTKNIALPLEKGLSIEHVSNAIREFGYVPYVSKPDDDDIIPFLLELKCYVRSGIPPYVHVCINDKEDNYREDHALSIVGFRENDELEPVPPFHYQPLNGADFFSAGLSRLYAHDDRLGPYARLKIEYQTNFSGPLYCQFQPLAKGFDSFEREKIGIIRAIYPLYHKIRLTAKDLIKLAEHLVPFIKKTMRHAKNETTDDLRIDTYFSLNGQYLQDLFSFDLPSTQLAAFLLDVRLSRYVGIIRASIGKSRWIDFICDTTDMLRDVPKFSPIIAIIPYYQAIRQDCISLVDYSPKHFIRPPLVL